MNIDPITIGRATELTGRSRVVYRLLEILPGTLSIGALLLLATLSFIVPAWVAYFTIAFSAYWLFKSVFLSVHLRHNFKRLMHNMEVDWGARLKPLKHSNIIHVVVFPFYQEPYEVVAQSVRALARSRYDTTKIAIVLAAEARAGARALAVAEQVIAEFKDSFLDAIVTVHPANLPGEVVGKGSNLTHASHEATLRIIDVRGIAHEHVIVSTFDVDTTVYPDYIACLTWNFLTAEKPLRSSYQPIPLYNNNIWSAPILSRVLAYSSTFWQMMQQERPERLSTFSSHAVPLPALEAVNFGQPNVVSEDSRIFWTLFLKYDGDYTVVPLSYPVSMDANTTGKFWSTVRNLYKQHRRWSYGAENIPYLIYNFSKNPRIPLIKKLRVIFVHIEGFWSLAVQPLVLALVGWMPLWVGGAAFNETVLSYNLPIVSSWFLGAAMFGLIVLGVYSMRLMPARPANRTWRMSVILALQWLLVPLTMVIFSAIPGIDAQIRLMTGNYLGFWVTPKTRDLKATIE